MCMKAITGYDINHVDFNFNLSVSTGYKMPEEHRLNFSVLQASSSEFQSGS